MGTAGPRRKTRSRRRATARLPRIYHQEWHQESLPEWHQEIQSQPEPGMATGKLLVTEGENEYSGTKNDAKNNQNSKKANRKNWFRDFRKQELHFCPRKAPALIETKTDFLGRRPNKKISAIPGFLIDFPVGLTLQGRAFSFKSYNIKVVRGPTVN